MIRVLYSIIDKKFQTELMEMCLALDKTFYYERVIKFRRWEDAQLSILGRLLLCKGIQQINNSSNSGIVKEYRNIQYKSENIKYDFFNKPYFVRGIINFNISHAGEVAVCAITDKSKIGIDIENVTDVILEDFYTQMTEKEQVRISSSRDRIVSFFYYWTQKEAVLKASGHGLSTKLNSFEIQNNQTIIGTNKYFIFEVPIIDNYICHIAMNEQPKVFDCKINKVDIENLIF